MAGSSGGNKDIKLSKAEQMAIELFNKSTDENLKYKILAEVMTPIEVSRQKKDEGTGTPEFFKEE